MPLGHASPPPPPHGVMSHPLPSSQSVDKTVEAVARSITKVDDSIIQERNQGVFNDWASAVGKAVSQLPDGDRNPQWYAIARITVKPGSFLLLGALQNAEIQLSSFEDLIKGLRSIHDPASTNTTQHFLHLSQALHLPQHPIQLCTAALGYAHGIAKEVSVPKAAALEALSQKITNPGLRAEM